MKILPLIVTGILTTAITATLTGLQPATTYTYRIGTTAGGWSPE